jgi:hypothetical protein
MTNQPLSRVDPLGRSQPASRQTANDAWPARQIRGSTWPISSGSMRPIVDIQLRGSSGSEARVCCNAELGGLLATSLSIIGASVVGRGRTQPRLAARTRTLLLDRVPQSGRPGGRPEARGRHLSSRCTARP